MILMNPTDDELKWSVGIHAAVVNGPEEKEYPPRQFIFPKGSKQEVPDVAVETLLNHLGPRGLVQITLHTDADTMAAHVAEMTAIGRRLWFSWLEMQVRRHQDLNEEMKQKGLKAIRPNPDVLRHYRKWKQLQATEFTDEILLDSTVPALGPKEQRELNGDPVRNQNAQREASRADEFEVPPAL